MAALPGDWDGLVVIQAATAWDGNRFQEQHLAEALSAHAPVLYVDPPMSALTPLKRPELRGALRGPRLRLLRPGLARLVPVALPWMERRGMVNLTTVLVRQAIRAAVRDLRGRVHAQVGMSAFVHTLGALGEDRKVYWTKDDLAGGAGLMGLSAERIARGEAGLAAKADLIIASSADVARAWRERGHDVAHIPPGYSDSIPERTDAAALPAEAADLPRPVAGFVGGLGERVDLPLLEAVAATGCSLLLVGPRQPHAQPALERLLARPNVRWAGAKPFEELAGYWRAIDVGLVPYTDSVFNRASFPLKTLEYLAAGGGVVATDLPAIRWLGTPLIGVATGPDAFAAAVTRALRAPRTPALVAERRAFAAQHAWSRRVDAFAAALGLPAYDPVRAATQASAATRKGEQ